MHEAYPHDAGADGRLDWYTGFCVKITEGVLVTVTDHSALLPMVLANPADDTARLVLADALRESESEKERALGRFIWGGVTVASFRDKASETDPLYRLALAEMHDISEQGYSTQWIAKLGLGPFPHTKNDWTCRIERDEVKIRYGSYVGIFTRGMLSGLTLSLGEWYGLSAKAFSLWPLEKIEIIDVPGLFFTIEKVSDGWELACGVELEDSEIADLEPDANFWSTSNHFDDRESLLRLVASDSKTLFERFNLMQEER